MKFEQPPMLSPEERDKIEKEKNMIKLSNEEYEILSRRSPDDPDLLKLMKEKGISFDNGIIEIDINGKKEIMSTTKDDFGTLKLPEKNE